MNIQLSYRNRQAAPSAPTPDAALTSTASVGGSVGWGLAYATTKVKFDENYDCVGATTGAATSPGEKQRVRQYK